MGEGELKKLQQESDLAEARYWQSLDIVVSAIKALELLQTSCEVNREDWTKKRLVYLTARGA